MDKEKTLEEVVSDILADMDTKGFSKNTIAVYRCALNRLLRIAVDMKSVYYSEEIRSSYLEDAIYLDNGKLCNERRRLHNRCDRIVKSFLRSGMMEWGVAPPRATDTDLTENFTLIFNAFDNELHNRNLTTGTCYIYEHLVLQFLKHIEAKGYKDLSDINKGDISDFFVTICESSYQAESLRGPLPGFRLFLEQNNLSHLLIEVPTHLQRKREILDVFSDEDYDKIYDHLDSDEVTLRDKAIILLAIETGLRSVDIMKIKKKDIDWAHDCIHIVQQKTSFAFDVPLTAKVGNALMKYMLEERPETSAESIFISEHFPYNPIRSGSVFKKIFRKFITEAGIAKKELHFGSRITRHSAASRLVRKGVPLNVISDFLGQKNPDSVLVYLTTDEEMLSRCTLPLPDAKEVQDNE